MRPVLSDERWDALRELHEVYGAPYRLLALAADTNLSTVRSRGLHQKWTREAGIAGEAGDAAALADAHDAEEADAAGAEATRAAALEELAGTADGPAELGALLLSQIKQLVTNARKGRVEKGRIDALSSLIRLVEKAEVLARDGAQEHKKRSDDELAKILERIDERIVELAEHHAERLVAGQADGG